jgi:GNAT superfamily N-acetyltransferase
LITQADRVSLVTNRQIRAAGEALAAAFVDDPLCVYTQPDVHARLDQFAWFFAQLVRDSVAHGGAYCHSSLGRPDGVAVWQPPEAEVWQPPEAEDPTPDLEELEQRFGREAYERFIASRHFERVRSQCTAGRPHWYLSALGVRPGSQRQGIGAALLEPGLRNADQDDLPCYLETFVPENVRFYEHRGFELLAAGLHLESRIAIWAMKREPSSTCLG